MNTAEKLLDNYKELPDNEVIATVLQGNKEMYEVIMRRYNQKLFRIGRSFINDDDEVQDILQASYIKAYENLKLFEHRSAFSTWLIRIVINEANARRIKSRRISYLSPDNQNDNYILYTMRSQTLNPEDEASNNELKDALEKVIDKLPDKYRTVFVMREIEGMSVAETSECLELSESNVKVRLNRAKEILKKSLVNVYKESDVFSFLGSRCDSIVHNVLNNI